MEKKLDIRVREDFDIMEFLKDAQFLDCGASKSAFVKNGICYKVPIGYEELDSRAFTKTCEYPFEDHDFNYFINQVVACEIPELVWSIGQIIYEIMVWKHLKQLEEMGYDISCFAAIKDYYIDKQGIPVIEQEYVHCDPETLFHLPQYNGCLFEQEHSKLLGALSDMGFSLRDIRSGNMGYNQDGILKCFDFGISSYSPIENYDTYESYMNYDESYNYEY